MEVVVVALALLMEPQVVLFEVGHSVEVVVEKVQERDLELNKKKGKRHHRYQRGHISLTNAPK